MVCTAAVRQCLANGEGIQGITLKGLGLVAGLKTRVGKLPENSCCSAAKDKSLDHEKL